MKHALEKKHTEDLLVLLGPSETVEREALEAEATMRRVLRLPPEVTWLEGLRSLLGPPPLERARRASARVRGVGASAMAERIARRALELGAISSDNRLAWPLRRLAAELDAAGERSARGKTLSPAGVRQALLRAGISVGTTPSAAALPPCP